MTDPQTGADLPRTAPRNDPAHPNVNDHDAERRTPTFLVPVVLAVVVLLAVAYFFYGNEPAPSPNVRADKSVTSAPAPDPK